MPSKYVRRAKIKYSTAELKAAAEAIVPVASYVVQQLVDRCVAMSRHGEDRAPRRSRGRGAQLQASEQLLVMFFAQVVTNRPREIADALGMHPRTVARVLASKKYEKVSTVVSTGVINRMRRNAEMRESIRTIFGR